MAWSTPYDFTTGEIVTASILDTYLSGNLSHLYLVRKQVLDYQQITSDTGITGTSFSSPSAVINGTSIAYDGSTPILFEFYTPALSAAAGNTSTVALYDGSTHIAILMTGRGTSGVAAIRFTPAAGSHTYQVKGWASNSDPNNYVRAGNAGGGGAYAPAYIRITTDGT
jgi:hypothetical protein